MKQSNEIETLPVAIIGAGPVGLAAAAHLVSRQIPFKQSADDRSLTDILRDLGRRHSIPVLADVDFGHTDPMITIPNGIGAALNSDKRTISLLEAGVV